MKYLIPEMIEKLDESEGRNVILMELVMSSWLLALPSTQ